MAESKKLLILLAKFSDSADVDYQPVSFYEDMFINHGTGGLNDYWTDASLGAFNLDGSRIYGWFTINQTLADFTLANPARWQKIVATIAASGQDTSGYNHVVCMFNVEPNDGGSDGGVIAGPAGTNLTFLAHETGHNFGLDHSYDESRRKLIDWSQPGEYYDSYDIMSAMNVGSDGGHRFSPRGPLLNTPNIRRMGWMPAERIWTAPAVDTGEAYYVDLVALEHPEIGGPLMIDLLFITAEFRMPDGWDSGISGPAVLVHIPDGHDHRQSVILASDRANYVINFQPGQTCNSVDHFSHVASGPKITVESFDLERKTARLKIINNALKPALPGLGVPDYVFAGGTLAGGGKLLVKVGNRFFRVPIPQPEIVTENGVVTAVKFAATEHLGEQLSLLEEAQPEVGMRSSFAVNGIVRGV